MIIATSNIKLAGYHQQTSTSAVEERLRVWTDGGTDTVRNQTNERDFDDGEATGIRASFDFEKELEKVSIEAAREKHRTTSRKKRAKSDGRDEASETMSTDTRLEVMRLLVEKLSGKRVSLYQELDSENRETDASTSVPAEDTSTETAPERVGFGIEYDYREVHSESETTRFDAAGRVTTADGRRISFDISMEMHRERMDVTAFSLRAGDAKLVDPLVVNFGEAPVTLTESKTDFDLDQDGVDEKISFVQSGSGFLVLDKNNDGIVNDGGELFGPSTGDGFSELSVYDEDANGWIDEADAVYDSLQIWTQGLGDIPKLISLAEGNVGAIYLGKVATPFELKNSENALDGRVQSSGVFLKETGGVGTVQQVDLVT